MYEVLLKHETPTGFIFSSECSRGQLETLSIGDYGKKYNIKADFLGFNKEINGVPNVATMPLSEKWVITLSTQYGCPQKCTFCSVPNIPFKGNASFEDLKQQFYNALNMFPNVKYTDRLNLHFARMGEPILNKHVFEFAKWLQNEKLTLQKETNVRFEVIHPVLTTSLPKSFGLSRTTERLMEWIDIKNNLYHGQAGLQFSINSTNEEQRQEMFEGDSLTLEELCEMSKQFPEPLGRKYCLNFAYASGYEIDPDVLEMFDKDKFMIKITPIHETPDTIKNNIKTIDGYHSWAPYSEVEKSLRQRGWDVLVFVPSSDEEKGTITCGNLILGGSKVTTEGKLNIEGLEQDYLALEHDNIRALYSSFQ